MAKKVVKNEVKTDTKKKGRKLKRSVRKTLGALFLASAIAVAAIPVEGLQAAPTEGSTDADWGTLDKNMPNMGSIPKVKPSDKIYSTGDGKFQFAYVPPTENSANNVAVILGYDKDGFLDGIEGGRLEIPNTVDAYARRTENLGTGRGFTAIGKNNEFIYYRVDTRVRDEDDPWEDDDKTIPKYKTVSNYYPCDYDTIKDWYYTDASHQTERPLEDFYYYPDNDTSADPVQTDGEHVSHQWIKNQAVRYIGNQFLTSDGSGGWTVQTGSEVTWSNKEERGIFAKAGNIVHLIVGDELSGIGDYAFYGCTNLESITLKNGMNTIGVGAFADCINMTEANVDVTSMLNVIGDYAFYRCQALKTFTVPNQVSGIGNSAFEQCEKMTTFNFGTENSNVLLSSMGDRVFKGCTSLKNITFKSNLSEEMLLTVFQGCTSLEYIELANNSATFNVNMSVSPQYDFDAFKADVRPTFYFKGIKDSALHNTATRYQVPFSYFDSNLGVDVYELTVTESDGHVVYRVDENDKLIYCGPGKKETGENETYLPSTISMPETIGPQQIRAIDSGTFQNRCEIKKVSIPSSIVEIQANAFVGCHQLEWVIFKDPNDALTIGDHAFQTQEGTDIGNPPNHETYKPVPELHFVGPISYSSEPFDYAMRPSETIDNGTQPETHITYHSEWPAFLQVQYDPEKDENVLWDYPTLAELSTFVGEAVNSYLPYYLTQERIDKLKVAEAVKNYKENKTFSGTDEKEIIEAAVDLVLPEGIEGIKKDLFRINELGENFETAANPRDEGVDKTITAESIINVDEEAFRGHVSLVGVKFSDATKSIGKHAFLDCKNLTSVSLPGTVEKLGIRPFGGCAKLSSVDFNGGPYFTCYNSIIYELGNDGETRTKLVEYLEGSKNIMLDAAELAGITELYPEAFMGTNVLTVDLSRSRIKTVPESCFEKTEQLATVTLPTTINGGSIEKNAFKDSSISYIRIPGYFINIDDDAFADAPSFKDKSLIIHCDEDDEDGNHSMAADWATKRELEPSYKEPEIKYNVRFFYYDDDRVEHQLGDTQSVLLGQSAVAPKAPEKEGYIFDDYYPQGWKAVTGNVDTYAEYTEITVETVYFDVIFEDYNGKEINKQRVAQGGTAVMPQSPTREGWFFQGWLLSGGDGEEYLTASSLTNIQANMRFIAQYRLLQDGEIDNGQGETPSPSPGTGTSGSPGPGTSGSPGPGTSASPGSNATLYTLTVQNGSGSGSYVEGAQPVIIANNPATGQVFDHWTVSPDDVKIASTVLSASVITMPAKDVTVTAHFKAGSGSGSGGTGSGNNTTRRPNGSESISNGGTTVVIDKNGLSNTGVVSATVHGSSDDFVVKITESNEATEAVLRALMAEYGDDLTNIRYFPMDITLYDSTGNNKITDTTGLSVDITLPLPDSLITYAGNNKTASVVNSRLERLSPKFTTIQGVSCVTFTAEHFSPYVIYADLGDLGSGLVSDDTPKTGDLIHPKWFLAIGLACLSFIFFMQKDGKKQPKKEKVKVKVKSR